MGLLNRILGKPADASPTKRVFAFGVAVFLSVVSTALTEAATITFKQGADIDVPEADISISSYNGAPDTYLLNGGSFSGGLSNFGNGSPIRTNGTGASSGNRKSLIRFDVSSLDGKYSSINSVTFRLYVQATSGAGGVKVFRLTTANSIWSEGTHFGGTLLSANDGNRTSYQNSYGSNVRWAGGPGAVAPGTDFHATPLATATNDRWTIDGAVDIPLTGDGKGGTVTDLFDDWVQASLMRDGWFTDSSNPMVPVSNEGIFIQGIDGSQNDFHSGEAAMQLRPELIVDFNPSGAVLPSDLTNNGFVDFEDLTILLANWNKDVTADDGNLVEPLVTVVNFADLTVLLAAWTGPGPAGSPEATLDEEAVPEPSSLLLALLATLGLSFYRRRRRRAA